MKLKFCTNNTVGKWNKIRRCLGVYIIVDVFWTTLTLGSAPNFWLFFFCFSYKPETFSFCLHLPTFLVQGGMGMLQIIYQIDILQSICSLLLMFSNVSPILWSNYCTLFKLSESKMWSVRLVLLSTCDFCCECISCLSLFCSLHTVVIYLWFEIVECFFWIYL